MRSSSDAMRRRRKKPVRSGDLLANFDEMQNARNTIDKKGGLSVDQYRQLLLGSRTAAPNSRHGQPAPPAAVALASNSGGGAGGPSALPTGSGSGALSAITRRLQQVEAAYAEASTNLREARAKNELLRQTVKDLKAVAADRGASPASNGQQSETSVVIALRRENNDLKKKVEEMESFLKSSGLKWTGYKNRSVDAFSGAGQSLQGHGGFDVDALMQQIKQLNIAAERSAASQSGYERRGDGSYKLRKAAKPLPLTIYRDGIFLMRGPLRPYSHSSTKAFLTDISNGHFPYEFKERFPNGVVLDVVDKRDVVSNEDTDGAGPNSKMSKSEFLRGVPKKLLTARGDIVHMRDDMAHKLNGTSAAPSTHTRTSAVKSSPKRSLQSPKPPEHRRLDLAVRKSRPASPAATGSALQPQDGKGAKTCKLLVSLPGGVDKIMLKMKACDTIADLRSKVRIECKLKYNFELRTAFPPRSYTDLTRTLQDEKLAPSAKVMVVAVN